MLPIIRKTILLVSAAAAGLLLFAGCMTPQERSGYNPKPFNTPARWELQPVNYRN